MPFSISALPSSSGLLERFWWLQVWLPIECPRAGDLLEDAGLVGGVLADREEDRARAMRGERVDDRHRALRPRTVVEGQHDFAGLEEVMLPEMLEAETGPAGGVDLDRARDADRIRIAGAGRCGRRAGRRCGGCVRCCRRQGLRKRRRLRGGAALRDRGRGVDRDRCCDDRGRRYEGRRFSDHRHRLRRRAALCRHRGSRRRLVVQQRWIVDDQKSKDSSEHSKRNGAGGYGQTHGSLPTLRRYLCRRA